MTCFDEVFLAADWAGAGAVRFSGFAAGVFGFEAGRGASELSPPPSRPTRSPDAVVSDGVWKKESSFACCCCFVVVNRFGGGGGGGGWDFSCRAHQLPRSVRFSLAAWGIV